MPFEIQIFSDKEKLTDYLKANNPQMLVLSEECSMEDYEKLDEKSKKIMYLSDHNDESKENYIYKYQSTDRILEQMMKHMETDGEKTSSDNSVISHMYGVYAPMGRCGKTTLSLLIGESLSRKNSVLYIGFDELSFFEDEENESREHGNLSDAYFYYQKEDLNKKLSSLVSHWHSVDILAGMNCPEDLSVIPVSEWKRLIENLAKESGYGAIVVDFGTKLWLAGGMFELCKHIYIPTLTDRYAKDKQRLFDEWSENHCEEVIRNRMYRIVVPPCNQNGTFKDRLEYALWGETGDFVRNILR